MATVVTAGQDFEIRVITLNATTDTPIDFLQKINAFTIKCRSNVDIYLRHDINSADYFTIPAGGSLTLDVAVGNKVPCYLRSSSGTVIVEVLGTF